MSRVAHDSAATLLHRVRGVDDPAAVERLVSYTDEFGIDDFVELWSHAAAHSLPGALFRLYLVREATRTEASGNAYVFRRGLEAGMEVSEAVAGPVTPVGPDEIRRLSDEILRGAFTGDFEIALQRASAFCLIMSRGFADIADGFEVASPERASTATRRSARYLQFAEDFRAAALLWRDNRLD